jgi:hypothetical protein
MTTIGVAGDNQTAVPLPADVFQLLQRRREGESSAWDKDNIASACSLCSAQKGVCHMKPGRAAVLDTTYLAAEEMVAHTAAVEVPDDDKAPAVANQDLVGVSRVFLQCLHHLKHSPVPGLLWQPGQGGVP